MPCRWQKPLGPSTTKSRTQIKQGGVAKPPSRRPRKWARGNVLRSNRNRRARMPRAPLVAGPLPGPSTAAGTQYRCTQILLGLALEGQERQQRQVALTVVVAVEERQLPGSMCGVVGWVQVDGDPPHATPEPPSMAFDDARAQLTPHPIQRAARRAVLEARDRRLRGHRVAGHRVAPEQRLVNGVVGPMVGVIAVGMGHRRCRRSAVRVARPTYAARCPVSAGPPDSGRIRPPARTPSRPP